MSQKILKQIRNEWRSNVWLCVELLIVSVVLWYVTDFLVASYTISSRPLGFDVEHCYKLTFDQVSETSPEYVPYDDEGQAAVRDLQQLLERLERRPEIEAVCVSANSHPYTGSNSGGAVTVDTLKASGYNIFRYVQPDFMRVFRYEGLNGETPEELAEMLRQGKTLISANILEEHDIKDPSGFIGKRVYLYEDTLWSLTVGAVIKPVRYHDYMQGQMNRTVVIPDVIWQDWTIRVRENMDKDIVEKLMADAETQFRVGNYYLANVEPFSRLRDNILRSEHTAQRNQLTIMAFLLVNIFLGMLGTFWFRTQQRVPDLAVRMVSGATRRQIFRLLTGEGLLLLTIMTPIALAIDLNLAHLELNTYLEPHGYFSWTHVLLCGGIAYGLMAIMIVAGIAVPASRAMRIAPAEALRDE
ncbi:MAG: ABC transporter permease [Muribaculaceae bacterium]|nr:ABC transporter permease [Muribaculaceae bacterium]